MKTKENEKNEMLAAAVQASNEYLSKVWREGQIRSYSVTLREGAMDVHVILAEVANKYVSELFGVIAYKDEEISKLRARIEDMIMQMRNYIEQAPSIVEQAKRKSTDKDVKIEMLTKELETLYVMNVKLETENNQLKQAVAL